MKRIKYRFLSSEHNIGTAEEPNIIQNFIDKDFPYSDEGLEAAKREAHNGEYEIYDDSQPEPVAEPTQLDMIEAQVFYTAMQTDTLLGV